jgi:Tol biopolymer transport system component
MLRVKLQSSLSQLCLVALIVPRLMAGSNESTADKTPATSAVPVMAVTQITHDGLSKTSLLSHGSELYVTESEAGRHVVAKITAGSSQRIEVPGPFSSFQALDLSADGKKLLISPLDQPANQNEFWVLPMGGQSAGRLGALSGRDAAWSLDGKQLVFGKGHDLYLANGDGSEARKLFAAEGSVFAPGFSPDNRHIRFTVGEAAENRTTIWEIDRDGSQAHKLLPGWPRGSNACCGSWTVDGRYYAFQSTAGDVTTLWAIAESDPTQGKTIQLTSGPMSFGSLSLSADSKTIWAIGVQPIGELVKYDMQSKKFVPVLSEVSATDLDFSPDGQWVAYVAIPERTLWRSRVDGSERLQLTSASERAALPRWSPDGNWIAFDSSVPGKPWKISIIPANGGKAEGLLDEQRDQVDANWSPDGKRMMFGYVRNVGKTEIRIIDIKTHDVASLPGSDGLFSPRWSPDGKRVAALSEDLTQLMLFDFASQKWNTWLKEPAGAVNYPTWSADSQYVYFDDLVTDEESIRRVKAGESQAERVFVLDGLERYPGPFGLWTGRDRDGSWMFVRDRSTQEVYQLTVKLP